jgi:hypothetical protein
MKPKKVKVRDLNDDTQGVFLIGTYLEEMDIKRALLLLLVFFESQSRDLENLYKLSLN